MSYITLYNKAKQNKRGGDGKKKCSSETEERIAHCEKWSDKVFI